MGVGEVVSVPSMDIVDLRAIITFKNLPNLNTSLQIGDAIYGCNMTYNASQLQSGTPPLNQPTSSSIGEPQYIGVLLRILERREYDTVNEVWDHFYDLYVHDNRWHDALADPPIQPGGYPQEHVTHGPIPPGWAVSAGGITGTGYGDYIMFSKYSQGDDGVLGYYANAKFVNNSKEKAELFAVSSEIAITSK